MNTHFLNMYAIEIANRQSCLDIDEDALKHVAEKTLRTEQVAEAQISIAVVDNAEIRRLNRQYLGRDHDTDVLSFLLESRSVSDEESRSVSDEESRPVSDEESRPVSGRNPPGRSGATGPGSLQRTHPVPRGRAMGIEGEVVLSAEKALQRAAEFRWSPHQELVLYLVHGLLHLVGYDDQSPPDRQLMRSRERLVLGAVSASRSSWESG